MIIACTCKVYETARHMLNAKTCILEILRSQIKNQHIMNSRWELYLSAIYQQRRTDTIGMPG